MRDASSSSSRGGGIIFEFRDLGAIFEVRRQSYNLLFEKFLLVNFTRSIRMSDEFRVMNSLDDLIHVRIDHWKLFAGHVLVDATRLTMTSERGGRQVARIQSACVLDLHIVKHKQVYKLHRIQPTSKFTIGQIHPLT